ncbi:acyltransferase [Pedobacter agri]|uniref:acyltransferase family protein n=1 Tax=Pedobacter agri TaxID=454586 RepID=UPI0029318E20|nr:acyltransferase [Pedobacter agri]
MRPHNYGIDLLRFIAALMVTLFHLNQAIIPIHNWYRNTINYGWLGVPIFFVISGYCIIASAEHTKGAVVFFTKRFCRIFPPYWFSLIIVLLSAVFQKVYLGTNSVHNLPKSLTAIIANITLGTAPFSRIETINWVYWSLTCEVAFYLLIGLGMFLNKKYLLYFILAISIASAFAVKQDYSLFFFLDHWPAFGLGISVYYFFKATNLEKGVNFGLLFIVNGYSLFVKHTDKPEHLIATAITITLLYLSIKYPLKRSFFSKLGNHSYSIYLIHIPIGVFILGLFESDRAQTVPFYNMIHDFCVFVVISLFAWGLYTFIEQPAINYGKKKLIK